MPSEFLSDTISHATSLAAPAAFATLATVTPTAGTGRYLVRATVVVTEADEPKTINAQLGATGERLHFVPTIRNVGVTVEFTYDLDENEAIIIFTPEAATAATRYTTHLSVTKIA